MLSFINMTSSSIILSLKTVLRTNYVLLNFLIFFFCFSCNSEIEYYENKVFLLFFKRFSSLLWFLISFVTPLKCRFCPSISKSRKVRESLHSKSHVKVFPLLFLISFFFPAGLHVHRIELPIYLFGWIDEFDILNDTRVWFKYTRQMWVFSPET